MSWAQIVGDVVAGLFVVTIIYVLVRPQSKGVDMINLFTSAVTALVKTATQL